MKSATKSAALLLAATLSVSTLAACSAGGTGGTPEDTSSFVDGAAFTMALAADPGNLDPQASAVSALFQLSKFAYDSLVSIDGKGKVGTQLATSWKLDGTAATLTMKKGVTCADGTTFTAKTAADNISWVENPENKSPFLGVYVPAGMTATAKGDVLTLTLAAPAPFLFQSLASLPMVCASGLTDRASLASKTDGTGPYTLTQAVPNDHYTYKIRKGYTWGPDGDGTTTKGLPATLTAKIVTNETTAANLLLSGSLNAAQIIGPDAQRLEAAKLFTQSNPALIGEAWYNQNAGHPAADPQVRIALTQALDLNQLQKVLTSGKGTKATGLAVVPPASCTIDSVSSALPKHDVSAAKSALDDAGWVAGPDGIRAKDGKQLDLNFVYDSVLGSGGTAAAELAVKQWKAIGVKTDAKQLSSAEASDRLFTTGDWDIAWEQLNVSSPDQLVGFLSGPAAPNGTNFAGIDNAKYSAGVTKATNTVGSDGCQTWADAESALVTSADVVPFANNVVKTFGKGAKFTQVGEIDPLSIRMLG
jgi:peptide/nickel transport system substrate-binding protein